MKGRIGLLLVVVMILSSVQLVFATEGSAVVYTEFKSGNSNHSGNGTQTSPYNLFEDALSAVANGGTIYVGENGAFINDTNADNSPFIINKSVNIVAKSKLKAPSITVRAGGIVLGGDVTFEDIELSFENSIHNSLFANGYSLVLSNTTYNSQAKVVHINAGSLYCYDEGSKAFNIAETAGNNSNVTIKGSSKIGNIYCGSINGSFDKPVKINLEDIESKNMGLFYASGALEGYSDPNQMLNPNYVPDPPKASSDTFPVNSKVEVNLNNTHITSLDGKTGGSGSLDVNIDTVYAYEAAFDNIENLAINSGTFAPTSLNNGVNITLADGATLNVSALNDFEANDFIGGGNLVLDKASSIKINGNLSGITDFRLSGGNLTSGLAEYNHMYIDCSSAKGNGSFTFNSPYPTQSDIKLVKVDGKWYTSSKPDDDATYAESFGIVDKELVVTKDEINNNGVEIPISITYAEDEAFPYVEVVAFVYKVDKDGVSSGDILSDEIIDIDDGTGTGNYEGNVLTFNMNFSPVTDSTDLIIISRNSANLGRFSDEIEAGTYMIEISAPSKGGYMADSIKLIVKGTEIGTVEELPTIGEVAYGTKLSEIPLTNGWKWVSEDIVPEEGSHEYSIFLDVDDIKYDYSTVDGYNAELHRVERKITVVAVAKKIGTVDAEPIIENLVAYGTKLSEIPLTGNWKWDEEDTIVSVGEGYYKIYCDVDDVTYDYSGVEGYDADTHRVERKIKVVGLAKPIGTVDDEPVISSDAVAYGTKLSEIPLTGNWKWDEEDTIVSVGEGYYKIYCDVDDETYDYSDVYGYEAETHRVERKIKIVGLAKPVGTVEAEPIIENAVAYGTKLSEIPLTGNWKWNEENTIVSVGENYYMIYCDVDDVTYDYSGVEGYNAETHRVERKIKVIGKATDVEKPIGTVEAEPIIENAVAYGTKLSEIPLTGNWKWEEEDIVVNVGENYYKIYCNVDDVTYDYSGVEGYNAETHRVERKIKVTGKATDLEKPIGTVEAEPIIENAVAYGTKLSEIPLTGNWKWNEEDTVVSIGENYYVIYCDVDDVTYDYSSVYGYDEENHRVERKIKVTGKATDVEKPIGTVEAEPIIENAVAYGTKLSEIPLTGNWKWEEEDTVVNVGENYYKIYCNVDDVTYDYSGVDGYNAETHKVEREIKVTGLSQEEPTVTYKIGDADGNGIVDISDVNELMKKALNDDYEIGLNKKTNDWLKYVDLDKDGVITATDAVMLLKML